MRDNQNPHGYENEVPKIPTNNAFRMLLITNQLHKNRPLVLQLFRNAGLEVSNAKLKSWQVNAGAFNKDFRPMPLDALEGFHAELCKYLSTKAADGGKEDSQNG